MTESKHSPKVSVFIPYYNDRDYLACAIESVLAQDFEDFELVLLNHSSTDDCRQIAHSYKDSRIVHLDYAPNLGAGSGLLVEAFLKVARGEYVKLFCADDRMRPNCLSTMLKFMREHPEADFAFGNVEYMSKDGALSGQTFFEKRPFFSTDNDEAECLRLFMDGVSFLPYIGSFAKRSAFDGVVLDGTFIMLFDVSLWVGFLTAGRKIGYCETVIADYRVHAAQMSSSSGANSELSMRRCDFERLVLEKFLVNFKDAEIARRVFAGNPYSEKIKDSFDACFVAAHELLSRGYVGGYMRIHEMLCDPAVRALLWERFGYGIAEFRRDYSAERSKRRSLAGFKNWKKGIYAARPKDLRLGQLCFLFARSFFNAIAGIFKTLRRALRRKPITL